MAFNTAEGRAEYTASSAQTEFTFTFNIFTTSDIKVYQTPSGDTPNDTTDLLTLTTDYTVTINGDNGGTITLNTGASTGDTIVLVRSLPLTRTTDYQDNGDLLASTLDTDQNYQTYLIVDSMTRIERTLTLGETSVGVSLDLTSPIADAYLKWNATADALENDTSLPDNVILSQASADEATAQADIATTKAGEASTNATNSQLKAWEAEAEKMTADSYATEAEDVFVKTYSSDGDGTFTATNTTEYSALHWAAKSALSSQGDAVNISYDNTTSALSATEVQGAIDEIVAKRAIFDSSIVFEGATDDAFETTLTVTDPTADRTITIPDRTFIVAGTDELEQKAPIDSPAFTTSATLDGTSLERYFKVAYVSASGTAIDFTGIPSWAKKIKVVMSGISTNGTAPLLIQIGDSGGVENTGYKSTSSGLDGGASVASYTSGFGIKSAGAALDMSGIIDLINIGSNNWVLSGVLSTTTSSVSFLTSGNKTLSGTLDRIRITTGSGTDSFDAGTVTIIYEG